MKESEHGPLHRMMGLGVALCKYGAGVHTAALALWIGLSTELIPKGSILNCLSSILEVLIFKMSDHEASALRNLFNHLCTKGEWVLNRLKSTALLLGLASRRATLASCYKESK